MSLEIMLLMYPEMKTMNHKKIVLRPTVSQYKLGMRNNNITNLWDCAKSVYSLLVTGTSYMYVDMHVLIFQVFVLVFWLLYGLVSLLWFQHTLKDMWE